MRISSSALVLVLSLWGPWSAGAQTITTKSLLEDMILLDGLAEFPSPAYTCKQTSSYDRRSKSPEDDWFANGDSGQFLRVEECGGRQEYVMADVEGPGALVRIWSANPAGTMRIYLDGAQEPSLAAPMSEILGGTYPGLPRPLAGEYSKGWNLYLPIPYAKHCKVTSDAGKFYYHVNYRTYEAGTAVETFRSSQIQSLGSELAPVAARLSGPASPVAAGATAFAVTVPPGQCAPLAAFSGSQAITQFEVQWTPSNVRDEPALRAAVLEMVFDGQQTVAAPLGDFFGTGPGLNPFESLPVSVAADGRLSCRWVMPFQRSAEIRVRNLGPAEVSLRGAVMAAPRPWTERSLHFHAKWRAAFAVPTEPKIDWNYLAAKGQGVFAGVAFSIDNPVREWWGEGDEKIYVDGETFPSHFGTGTEDYYGYAWCFPGLFTHAYHNQTRCDGPRNYGRTSVNRWHILDRIPFAREFRFDMELWHWKKCDVNLAVLACWYARPGGSDAFAPLAAGDLCVRPVPEVEIPKVAGAIEGESLKILQGTGAPRPQSWDTSSDGAHLWWAGGQKPGDQLVLGFPVTGEGRYRVKAQLLQAVDYGVAQIAINGRPAGHPVDFYHEPGVTAALRDLGVWDLREGENTISFTFTGAHPKAKKAYMIGLDYLLLERAE